MREILRHLLGHTETTNRRSDGQPQFSEAGDLRIYKVDHLPAGWSQIDLDRLPGAGAIGNRDVHSHGVRLLHIPGLGLESKSECVESKAEGTLEYVHSASARSFQPEVQVLGGAGSSGKAQFQGDSTLEEVRAQDLLLHCPFEDPAKREKGHPAAQPFLI